MSIGIILGLLSLAGVLTTAITSGVTANKTNASNESINEASLEQSQEQFQLENWLNSTQQQVQAANDSGINADFQDISSLGSGTSVDYTGAAANQMASNSERGQAIVGTMQDAIGNACQIADLITKNSTLYEDLSSKKKQNALLGVQRAKEYQDYVDNLAIQTLSPELYDKVAQNANFDFDSEWLEDSELLESAQTSVSRFDDAYFQGLGFEDAEAKRLARVSRSALSRRNVKQGIYDSVRSLRESRAGYDESVASPLTRDENQDMGQVAISFYQKFWDNKFQNLDLEGKQIVDTITQLRSRSNSSYWGKYYTNEQLNLESSIAGLQYALSQGLPLSNVDAQMANNSLRTYLDQLEQSLTNVQYDCVSDYIKSDNAIKRSWGFYMMQQLQNGQFFPFQVADDASTALTSLFDTATSAGAAVSTWRDAVAPQVDKDGNPIKNSKSTNWAAIRTLLMLARFFK